MNFELSHTIDSIKDGTKEVAETAHKKTSEFHEKYVSKVVPDFGKYGDAAKFIAEMAPGVSEYNAIREGDWQGFAIAAGIDVAAFAIGAVSAGSGYAAVKGGSTAAKAGAKTAAKEIAEAGAEKVVKEVAEAGVEKVAKEAAEAGVEKVAKEAAEAGVEKVAKEAAEAGAEKVAKEAAEAGAEKVAKEVAEAGTEKAAKEIVETGVEKTAKEAIETGAEKTAKEVAEVSVEKAEKTILEVGDKIDKTRFSEYIDEIEKITKREIPAQQKELLDHALKENDYFKLDKTAKETVLKEYRKLRAELIQEWEKNTGNKWPRYVEDVLNESGAVIRKAGDYYDAHHIIEVSVGGPNKWWNLTPAKFPSEHQNGIHAAGKLASKIFG